MNLSKCFRHEFHIEETIAITILQINLKKKKKKKLIIRNKYRLEGKADVEGKIISIPFLRFYLDLI